MEDDAYARRLFAILTNPHPTGIDPDDPYGQADDGLDRYDGFGRDVWVESVRVADGEFGAELHIEFGLALPSGPDWRGVPQSGTLRLPAAAEWREVSGYADPAAYAPVVAREVEIAAGRHVERHRSRPAASLGAGPARPVPPGRDAQWQVLLDALGGEGAVAEVGPGRIEVREADRTVVTLVVSPDQWERVLLDHTWGDVDLYFAELLGPRQEDEAFVVFYNGDLSRSTREKLPPVRGRDGPGPPCGPRAVLHPLVDQCSARGLTLAGHLLQNPGCRRCRHQLPYHIGVVPHLAAQPFQKDGRGVLGVEVKEHGHVVLVVRIPKYPHRPGARRGATCGIAVEDFLEFRVVPDRIAYLQGEHRCSFPSSCARTTIGRPISSG
ncbi:hypothetical protein [Arthrobacter ginkgonis]|uniref:hypothetical protein n=1 Tax=Arthrobacter ginkgonis TaxID=1630594 RepID=UPI0031E62055